MIDFVLDNIIDDPNVLIILSLAIFIIVIFGIFSSLFFIRRSSKSFSIALQRLLPSLFIIAISMILIPGFLFWSWESKHLQDMISESMEASIESVEYILQEKEKGLSIATKILASDKDLANSLADGDADSLFLDWEETFQEMRDTEALTHFYFLDTNRTVLLRLHAPERSGDLIDRFTARQAESTKESSAGLEIGPLGILTVRVVEPVFVEGEVVGYVELGKEIESVLQDFFTQTGNDLVVTIKKDFLDRDSWEAGMSIMGREGDWDHLDDKVISYSSIDLHDHVWGLIDTQQEFTFDDRNWSISSFPVVEKSDKLIGEIIIARDVTLIKEDFTRVIFFGVTLGLIISSLLMGIIYVLLRRTDNIINNKKKELEESIGRIEELSEQSRTFFWEMDKNGYYTDISPFAEEVIGYTPEELIGKKTVFDIHPEEGRGEFKASVEETMRKKEKIRSLENPIISKDGEIVWVASSGLPVLDSSGDVIGYKGADTDITSQKKTADALSREKQELEKFKLAVKSAFDAIVITDKNGICLYVNDAAESMTGFSKEELIGRKLGTKNNWGGSMEKEFYDNLWRTIKEEKKSFLGEIKNRRKNGEEYDVELRITPILDNNDEVVFFVGIERDITEEKIIDRVKKEFVSLASHQLRAPLSAVSWYTEMLLDGDAGELTEDQKEYLEDIDTSNKRMINLINSLLDVSRLELGTFSVDPEPTNISSLAKSVIKELTPEINKRSQSLNEKYEDNLSEISADPQLLRIIFQNILSNSIKYSPEGGVIDMEVKTIKAGEEVDGRKALSDSILIIVKDNGFGIPKHQHDKIFSKLFRADNISIKDTEGTGLGLYIVKSIIDHSKGDIWFDSEEGKGTTFYVLIPLAGMEQKKGEKHLN